MTQLRCEHKHSNTVTGSILLNLSVPSWKSRDRSTLATRYKFLTEKFKQCKFRPSEKPDCMRVSIATVFKTGQQNQFRIWNYDHKEPASYSLESRPLQMQIMDTAWTRSHCKATRSHRLDKQCVICNPKPDTLKFNWTENLSTTIVDQSHLEF